MTVAEQLIQEGIKQGKREASLRIARELLQKGLSIQMISELTELSEEEIKAL